MPTYSRLTREQRYTIEAMNRNGSPQNEIANAIGKHPSTVSRELRRLGVCRDYCGDVPQIVRTGGGWLG